MILFLIAGLCGSSALAKTRLVVFPVVPLAGEVEARSAHDMTKALMSELGRIEDLEVVETRDLSATVGGAAALDAPRPARSDAGYKAALGDLEEGAKQAQKLRFPQAIKALGKGIEGLAQNLDLLDNYQRLIDAHLMLAVSHFRRGQEAAGTEVLEGLARLCPDLKLDPSQYPPVFLGTFEKARERALARKRGGISVTSAPAGATVVLNGKELGRTPLVIDEVIPGHNHLVIRSGSVADGHVIEVTEGKVTSYAADLGGGGEVTLGDAVASNRFDRDVRQAARRISRDLGGDYLVLGAMGRGKGVYSLALFLGNARTGQWVALDPAAPDIDLISAATEARGVARNVSAKLVGFKGDIDTQVMPFVAGKPVFTPGAREPQRVAFIRAVPQGMAADSGREPVVAAAATPVADNAGERAPVAPVRRDPLATRPAEAPVPPPAPAPAPVVATASNREPVSADSGRHPVAAAEPASEPARASKPAEERAPVGKPARAPVVAKSEASSPAPGPRRDASAEAAREPKVAVLAAPADGTAAPLGTSTSVDAQGGNGGLLDKWWFWTAVGVGAVALAGGSYLLFADRSPSSGTMVAVW